MPTMLKLMPADPIFEAAYIRAAPFDKVSASNVWRLRKILKSPLYQPQPTGSTLTWLKSKQWPSFQLDLNFNRGAFPPSSFNAWRKALTDASKSKANGLSNGGGVREIGIGLADFRGQASVVFDALADCIANMSHTLEFLKLDGRCRFWGDPKASFFLPTHTVVGFE